MGRPIPNREETIAEAKRLYGEGLSMIRVADTLGVSQSWAHRAIKSLSRSGRENAGRSGHGTMRCERCGRPNITRAICYKCADRDNPKQPPCRMALSAWQTLADGTRMRTLTGV